jgi:hypothetical protein
MKVKLATLALTVALANPYASNALEGLAKIKVQFDQLNKAARVHRSIRLNCPGSRGIG